MSVVKARAQLGNAVKAAKRNPESAVASKRVADARQNLASAKLDAHVRTLVESAPKLTPAQRDALSIIVRGSQ